MGARRGYWWWDGARMATWSGFGYDFSSGRLAGMDTPGGWVGDTYAAGWPWLQKRAVGAVVTTREPGALGRLAVIRTEAGGAVVAPDARSAYGYDAAGRRSQVTRADGSYWQYAYNGRNEVTSGTKRWSDQSVVTGINASYGYDAIGNRLSGSATPANGSAYRGANALNQLTYIYRMSYSMPVIGEADAAASATVNGLATSRKGSYFSGSLPAGASNTSMPKWAAVAVQETKAGQSPIRARRLPVLPADLRVVRV